MEKDLQSQDTGQSLPFVTTSGGAPTRQGQCGGGKDQIKAHSGEKSYSIFSKPILLNSLQSRAVSKGDIMFK